MLLTRIYMRNFRVYEDEVNLEIPPGLVGIYGPNGAGKSTLLEAVLFTLWGKSRTTKEHIRSSGVGGDCVTEVEFEHEGHLYLARRILKGINSTVSVEVHCDGLLMSTGTRDAERYIESVLGMDDSAFRASVFAEQKQLAAFSDQTPADRRKLVLQLLGITPLDSARDAARRDARQLASDHDRLRGMLIDVTELEVEASDAEAKAAASAVVAADHKAAAEAAEQALERASAGLAEHDTRRQEHEALVADGKRARQELDAANAALAEQREELERLSQAEERLAGLQAAADGLAPAESELRLLEQARSAAVALDAIELPPEPPAPDLDALEASREACSEARESAARHSALADSAEAELRRAREVVERAAGLSADADCPVCGQELGAAFETVQAHRASDLASAELRHREAAHAATEAAKLAEGAARELAAKESESARITRARGEWEKLASRRSDAQAALAEAWHRLSAESPRFGDEAPAPADIERVLATARADLEAKRSANAEAQRLRGMLERRPALEATITSTAGKADLADQEVTTLRDKVRALGFDPQALRDALDARDRAAEANRAATRIAGESALEAAKESERSAAAARRLTEAREQHAKLSELESDARHVGRVADLLSEFRNTVVATVGPRLSTHAADLFAELTDREYDELSVDPETYELRISDGGRVFGLDRFSGSEIDLANLALRVAISEHIHFQSGGSVGLLVLDEVFGPLDEDRKARMLVALERLRGRFRQVLVVTHDSEIKEQLPNAVEVVKLPGRRATARLMLT